MTRIRFQQSLEELKEQLLVMAGLAEQSIQRAIEAYRVRDLSICNLVSISEMAINRLEREIDQAALDLLAMEQPMAIDLRFILSVIKINADLERVGDAIRVEMTAYTTRQPLATKPKGGTGEVRSPGERISAGNGREIKRAAAQEAGSAQVL